MARVEEVRVEAPPSHRALACGAWLQLRSRHPHLRRATRFIGCHMRRRALGGENAEGSSSPPQSPDHHHPISGYEADAFAHWRATPPLRAQRIHDPRQGDACASRDRRRPPHRAPRWAAAHDCRGAEPGLHEVRVAWPAPSNDRRTIKGSSVLGRESDRRRVLRFRPRPDGCRSERNRATSHSWFSLPTRLAVGDDAGK